MRRELTDFNWHVYHLSIDDFDYTLNLTVSMIKAKLNEVAIEKMEKSKGYPADIAGEIISDIAYYGWTETQYIWHFCLWRLQGIFEGIITHKYIDEENKMSSLTKKLKILRKNGYDISDQEFNDLIQWANLRNALSHFPLKSTGLFIWKRKT